MERRLIGAVLHDGDFSLRRHFADQLALGAVELAVVLRVEFQVTPAFDLHGKDERAIADRELRVGELRFHNRHGPDRAQVAGALSLGRDVVQPEAELRDVAEVDRVAIDGVDAAVGPPVVGVADPCRK